MLGHGIVDRIKGETGPRHRHLDTKVSVWERSDRSEKIGDRQMLAATILWARLIQFIMISRASTLSAVENTHIVIGHDSGIVNSSSQTSRYKVEILCRELDWQVSSLEQVCTSCLPLLTTEDLYIQQDPYSSPQPDWQGNIENSLWLELLHPFSTVKNLHLSKEIVRLHCKSLLGTERQKCCPPSRIFSWRRSSQLGVSRKTLGSSLPRDSSRVTL